MLTWLDKDMAWLAPKAGHTGRPPVFTDAANPFRLRVKVLFGLPLRQTTGMMEGILSMAGLDWRVPDFSTQSRRQKRIPMQVSNSRAPGPLNLLVDSTGTKFLGDGEWFARKHGTHRRRQYRKVHLAMDMATGGTRAVEFTSSDKGDSPVLPHLLDQHPLRNKSSPAMVPSTPGGAARQSSSAVAQPSYPSARTGGDGGRTALPPRRAMRSSKPHNIWDEPPGNAGPDTPSEVG